MATVATLQIATITLQVLGFILLALLLFTIQIATENGRHPLFINFLVTWVMYSAFSTYYLLGVFTIPQLEQQASGYTTMIGTQYDIFGLMPLVSTLNLVIHVWFMTWNSLSRSPKFLDRYWTPILLATPYLAGLIPLLKLWSLIGDTALTYIALGTMMLTTLMDVLLLIILFSNHRLVRHAARTFRSAPIACESRKDVVYLTKFVLFLPPLALNEAIFIPRILYIDPLIVFVLFGLHRDILRFWFPCISPLALRRATDSESIDSVTGIFTSNGQIVYDIGPLEPVESLHEIVTERRTARGGAADGKTEVIEIG
ncbi:hypothetical protein BU17DRAFT_69206 [Hysterangium stoloniferum]|nr:hypothetical protein BU17DRAFT_69206 [Hysterangium stoloniferum]